MLPVKLDRGIGSAAEGGTAVQYSYRCGLRRTAAMRPGLLQPWVAWNRGSTVICSFCVLLQGVL